MRIWFLDNDGCEKMIVADSWKVIDLIASFSDGVRHYKVPMFNVRCVYTN